MACKPATRAWEHAVVCRNCQHIYFLLLSVHNRHMYVSIQQNSAHKRFALSKQYFGRLCTLSSELPFYTPIQKMPLALSYFAFTRTNSKNLCKVCVFITGNKSGQHMLKESTAAGVPC